MKKFIVTLCVLICGVSTGCSTMNSSFDCPNKAGVQCKSLDQINGMVDDGQIQGRTQSDSKVNEPSGAEFQPYSTTASYFTEEPLRYGEAVQRIWVAPFEDTEGNYHQDHFIYTIAKGGHWTESPVSNKAKLV